MFNNGYHGNIMEDLLVTMAIRGSGCGGVLAILLTRADQHWIQAIYKTKFTVRRGVSKSVFLLMLYTYYTDFLIVVDFSAGSVSLVFICIYILYIDIMNFLLMKYYI